MAKAKCSECNGAKKGEPLYKGLHGELLCTYCFMAQLPDREYVCDVGDEINDMKGENE